MSEQILDIPGETKHWVLRRHRILGKGNFGCATLYEEVDAPGSFVVVKDVNMQTMKKEDEMKALEIEVEILRRSRGHPNIVQFYDYYHDGEFMVYIIMEYCSCGDIGQLIEQLRYDRSHRHESFVASIMIQMIVGLYDLHVDQRVLHRDIKPQNLFLCHDNVLRIGDFGISTILDPCGDVAKLACGSPFYMSPEMCEERAYNGKADLWSLGVTLYELMVLERPFTAKSAPALSLLITRGTYAPIPLGQPYSKGLIDLVQSFLQTSASARPSLRRVLRSTYVQQSLSCLPLRCLESPLYKKLFAEEIVQNAIKQRGAQGSGNGHDKTSTTEKLSSPSLPINDTSEMELWLEEKGGKNDPLADLHPMQKPSSVNEQSLPKKTLGDAENTRENVSKHSSTERCDECSDEVYEDDFESECSGQSKNSVQES